MVKQIKNCKSTHNILFTVSFIVVGFLLEEAKYSDRENIPNLCSGTKRGAGQSQLVIDNRGYITNE